VPSIKTIVWNSDQRRLRTLWRLIGQLMIMAVFLIIVEGAVGFLVVGMLLVQEGVSPDQLTDPQVLRRFIMENPLPMMLSSIGLALSVTSSLWLAGRLLDRRPFADFGLHIDQDWLIDFGFGLVLGAVLMLIIFLVELAAGWATVSGTLVTRQPGARFLPAILVPAVTFLAVGFYEELFSRGYQLLNLAEGLNWGAIGPRGAILIATLLSSMVFGALHAGNPNASIFSTLSITVAGLQLAAGILLTGELAIPIGLHITWNFFQGNVFGFPVSGNDFSSATFISIEQGGPDLWTGGAFGPEAGLLGLGAMLLGILLTVLWVRRRSGQVGLDLSLAEAPILSPAEGPGHAGPKA
jgi:membrane protease YdiL (CAAX protease family)